MSFPKKNTGTILDHLFSKSESKEHKDKMKVLIDAMEKEYEDTEKGEFTSSSGSGFSTGMGIGAGLDTPGGTASPTISGARSATSSVAGTHGASSTRGGTGTSPSSGSSKNYSSGLKYSKSNNDCADCAAGKCPHKHEYEETAKAVKASSITIPRHMRGPYDPNHIRRSATQQTSRMYTQLAPAVQGTIQTVKEIEKTDPRINAVKSQKENSRKVQELRDRIAASFVPRTGMKFTR